MADLPLVFHPDARIDALAAYDWYFQRSPHAAEAFQNELREAGLAIQRAPERWAEYTSGTRRYLMKRFPFVVVYRIVGEQIQVVAVAHGRQKPGYWKARITSP
ncbi:MAG: type II toxin-antitoxin system RelE/ParE family toxin [Pirellulales bacterium]